MLGSQKARGNGSLLCKTVSLFIVQTTAANALTTSMRQTGIVALPLIQAFGQAGCGASVLAIPVDHPGLLTRALVSTIIDMKCYFV